MALDPLPEGDSYPAAEAAEVDSARRKEAPEAADGPGTGRREQTQRDGGAISNWRIPKVLKRDAMTKAELVEEVADVLQLTKKHAEVIVNTLFDSIVESLQEGTKIELRGFGSFRLRDRAARIGRNPRTGEQVEVPAKRIPYFRPGKELKGLLNSD